MSQNERVQKAILFPDKLFGFNDVNTAADARSPGVYGWWIENLSNAVPLDETRRRDGFHLVYIGKSESSLRRRLSSHYDGCASHSTLQKTLGVLLQNELDLAMQIVRWTNSRGSVTKKPRFGWGSTEDRLSRWMAVHAKVVWAYCDDFKGIEALLINSETLPLNLKGNTRHAFHRTLSDLRNSAEKKAIANHPRSGNSFPAS